MFFFFHINYCEIMKESIEYNYNITIDNFNEENNVCSFIYYNDTYLFVQYLREKNEIDDIISCSKELKTKNIISYDIMFNKENKVITKIDDVNYVMLKLSGDINEDIDIIKMIDLNRKTKINEEQMNKYKNNWDILWSEKIDYFEYQISQLGKSKYIILDSFSYYVGLAENAIALAQFANKNGNYGKASKVCLSHRRIYHPNLALNYYNPISYIFDLEVRDIAEYIKSIFFSGEDAFLEITTYLKSNKLDQYSYYMLYARLLFPSYYFDLYEQIIENKINEDNILSIIKDVDKYEEFLKKTYLEISKYVNIDKIEWLLK